MQPTHWDGEIVQLSKPYYSTIAIEEFLARENAWKAGTEVLDIGTGIGANLFYFREKWPTIDFLGTDYNATKIEEGQRAIEQRGASGIKLEPASVWELPQEWVGRFDGITVIHTLCVFPKAEPFLEAVVKLKPRWIALNSLFHPGPLDVLVHIRDRSRPWLPDENPDGDFNIFSLPITQDLLSRHGYRVVAEPFYPPVDLPKHADGSRGTYTMATELSPRTQFSGPVFLPWYFVLAIRDE